jgi:hypothetical protein
MMRNILLCLSLGCSLVANVASAQANKKSGLWEVTSTMTFEKSPLPPGMQAPAGSPFSGAPRTSQVCVTQAMIDKYGGPSPAPAHGDCQIANISIKPTGMTASIACTGQMAGNGTVEATFTDANSTQTKVHFAGSMQMGPRSAPVEWTMQSNSTFKNADCGSVKPVGVQ